LVERKSLLGVQATAKGKAPDCSFPFTCAMLRRNSAFIFVGARVYIPPKSKQIRGSKKGFSKRIGHKPRKSKLARRANALAGCREGASQTSSPPHTGVGKALELGSALRRDRRQPVGVA
jgi:hypothetical protein